MLDEAIEHLDDAFDASLTPENSGFGLVGASDVLEDDILIGDAAASFAFAELEDFTLEAASARAAAPGAHLACDVDLLDLEVDLAFELACYARA